MARVEFTSRAEENILGMVGADRLDQTLLVVDVGEGEAQLSVHRTTEEWERLQRDIEMVGPYRVPIGGERIAVFVRGPEGHYEVDYYACGGRTCYQIRPLDLASFVD